jgi:hypothetical protein
MQSGGSISSLKVNGLDISVADGVALFKLPGYEKSRKCEHQTVHRDPLVQLKVDAATGKLIGVIIDQGK